MAKYRSHLPQLSDDLFLTDGGLETTLIFHDGLDLPYFAAYNLLKSQDGRESLRAYYERYAAIARSYGANFILESATWRASADWGEKMGYSRADLAEANRQAIAMLAAIRAEYETPQTKIVISGCIGPRGDGYNPSHRMTVDEAQAYHEVQIDTFAATEADMVTALTLNYVEESIGIARAAQVAGLPVVLSFTVETDGKLPTGETLQEAIERVDEVTAGAPVYYMINCAHPTHFAHILEGGQEWLNRIRGLRANASRMSHAELDEAEELDDGHPQELGDQYAQLKATLTHLNVVGGCCGTDHRHVEAICRHFTALATPSQGLAAAA